MIIRILVFLLFSMAIVANAQMPSGVEPPGSDYVKKCGGIVQRLSNLPAEVSFGVRVQEDHNLYFVITHAMFMSKIFNSGNDGFFVDVVAKDQYECGVDQDYSEAYVRGKALPVVYYKDMKKQMQVAEDGWGRVLIGKLPARYWGKEVEFNIAFLEKNNYCHYHRMFNLQSYRWDLLEMGLMMDTLTYKSDMDSARQVTSGSVINSKELKFEVLFEKNKSEYAPEDLQPLFDSLQLSTFNVLRIDIHAYASVEGTTEHNLSLQQKRASSIAQALEAYQSDTIETVINASENWVDFFNEISTTKHADLAQLSKSAVKAKLLDPVILADVEPVLMRHRKALIRIELQKKSTYMEVSNQEIIHLFADKIKAEDIEGANSIQNEIMSRISSGAAPPELLDELEIPQQYPHRGLLSNKYAFKYLNSDYSVQEAYDQFLSIEKLSKKNPKVKYNLCALKFRLWLSGEMEVKPDEFMIQIKRLTAQGINSKLVKRMLINHHIIMSAYYMRSGEFDKKDRSLSFIRKNYKLVPAKSADYLSLAQYFASFARYDWAKEVLRPQLKDLTADEDMLFYYLNLTIATPEEVAASDYRIYLLNAIEKNNARFCALFDPVSQNGVSFQLLESKVLKQLYCENCSQ